MPDLSSPHPLLTRALGAGLALTMAGLLHAPLAMAAPDDQDVQAQVATLDGQLARTEADLVAADSRAATAVEVYNQARESATTAKRSASSAAQSARAARTALAEAKDDLAVVVSQAYRQSGQSPLLLALTAPGDTRDALDRAGALSHLAGRRDDAVQRVTAAAAVSEARGAEARAAADQAAVTLDDLAAARDAAQAEQAALDGRVAALAGRRQQLLAELADIQATTLAAERRRQETLTAQRAEAADEAALTDSRAATTAVVAAPAPRRVPAPAVPPPNAAPSNAAPANAPPADAPAPRPAPVPSITPAPGPPAARPPAVTPSTPPRPAPTSQPAPAPVRPSAPPAAAPPAPPPAPAPSGNPKGSAAGGAAAVEWARTQLGKAYLWGGEGPDAYDCSGLTMRAWGRSGLSLPHSSRSQYAGAAKIDRSQLRPGDLIFWGSDPSDPGSIHHVAMYSGNGMVIEAPNSRSVVREVPVRWSGTMPMAGRP